MRGVSAQAPLGIKTEFDVLIYATGFDGVTGAYDSIDLRRRHFIMQGPILASQPILRSVW